MERSAPRVPERAPDAATALPMAPEPAQEPGAALLQDPRAPPQLQEQQELQLLAHEELGRPAKGPGLGDEPHFRSPRARHEPDVGLEAHDEADEPDPGVSGAAPAAAQRTQLGPLSQDAPEPPRALLGPALAVSWEAEASEESTLEAPCPGASPAPFSPEPLDSDQEPPEPGHIPSDPRSPEGDPPQHAPKHLREPPDAFQRSLQRLGWLSRGPRSPSPSFQPDGAAPRPAAFPKPLLAKAKPAESCRRKVPEPEWSLPGLDVGKQSWTVNAEASLERLPPAPCGSFSVQLLLQEPPKEEQQQQQQEMQEDPGVFTCIECSIYFGRKEHLQEHMLQHRRGAERCPEASPGRRSFRCGECGWALPEAAALERHRRLHQESRQRILQEIQKLDELPDEGREARLQCPKCVFGTNSSKVFVQHAKMHVQERKEQGSRGSGLFGEQQRRGLCRAFRGLEEAAAGKGPGSCGLCGFPAPNEQVLQEHLSYAHSHLAWQPHAFPEDPEQPGPSRDCYSPAGPERLFPCAAPAQHEPGFASGHPRPERAEGVPRKDPHGFHHARKAAPYQTLGFGAFSSSLQQLRKRAATPQLEGDGDTPRGHPAGMEEVTHEWQQQQQEEVEEEQMELGRALSVPQAALELKRTFRAALRDPALASEGQRHQLRMMVPVVLLEELGAHPKAKRARVKPLQKNPHPQTPREALLEEEEALPLDVLLLEAPLEGPLELEELLGAEGGALKNEERKCPYCPDRFHNGIGLANHVRGHLNRVGVSYNVRHFISAEEVKAIEQRFSFQKKKKKVANFDPGTFSLMRCEFCGAGFDTRAGLSSHARAHLRDFGITNWELTVSPIHILKELLATSSGHPALLRALLPSPGRECWDPPRDPPRDPRDPPRDPPREPRDPPRDPPWEPHWDPRDPPWDPPRDPQRDLGSPLGSAFAPGWLGEEVLQPYRDVLAPDEDELVAVEVTSPPALPKKALEPPPPRLGTKLSPEPPGSKAEPHDSKAPSLTTCEVCGACFETRKGLSSHARSHLRQLGVAESESSGAPIDLLYELVRHKPKPKPDPSAPALPKKPSPKEPGAASAPPPPRPLLPLPKPEGGSVNKAIKSPPGFSKSLPAPAPPGSPGLKKVPGALPGSPGPKGAEEKGAKLALSPLPAEHQWAPEEDGPLNLTSGSEPCRDIRCEFCGEFFENRKGLSSHARSHLRQMGVTEWYVNGSPIDTLREILTRRRPGAPPKALAKSLLAGLAPLEPRPELHVPALPKKAPLSPPGPAPGAASSPPPPPPPTARKVFPGLSAPALQRKLKQDQLRVEIKRELMAAGGGGGGGAGIHPGEAAAPPDPAWAAHEEMAPLNLSSRADPVRDIRCEFCGEFFENRKGLSSHARSHLRQMGVTEWSVNGSPIDTLREILRKKSKPCLIKKEPALPSGLEAAPGLPEDGLEAPGSPGKALPAGLALKAGAGLALAPLGAKNPGAFLAAKRPLPEERLGGHGEAKHKAFELGFKAKALHDKASAEACCELCGLYFENRKALASHARAHLRQFGVTEWCVNGSPIETLREWIRHRPHKAGAYRSYIQGGRPFSKKFRGSGQGQQQPRGALALPYLGKAALAAEAALGEHRDGKGAEGAERALGTALGSVKVEEQRGNFSKFERRQPRPLESRPAAVPGDFPRKAPEARPPPPRVRPVPALVPRPPQTSLVKFVGNIYTLKCRFCEVEFQGPLSIQEEWVRHLQRHILDMNFSKADPCRSEAPPEPPALPEAP